MESSQLERIEPSENEYFQEAKNGLQVSIDLRSQVEHLSKKAAILEGTFESYADFLVRKYDLDKLRDRIEDDGTIVRAATRG